MFEFALFIPSCTRAGKCCTGCVAQSHGTCGHFGSESMHICCNWSAARTNVLILIDFSCITFCWGHTPSKTIEVIQFKGIMMSSSIWEKNWAHLPFKKNKKNINFKKYEVIFHLKKNEVVFEKFRSSSIFMKIEVISHISSSWVKIKLHTRNQLPSLPRTAIILMKIEVVVVLWFFLTDKVPQ